MLPWLLLWLQVIGLTASVGVGKARDVNQAVTHILSLCANLDSQAVVTVKKHTAVLARHVINPDESMQVVYI